MLKAHAPGIFAGLRVTVFSRFAAATTVFVVLMSEVKVELLHPSKYEALLAMACDFDSNACE